MRRSRFLVSLAGLIVLTALPLPALAQQDILVSKGFPGRHIHLNMAVNPDTGDVLVVWILRNPADTDDASVVASLLKRRKNGTYKRKRPRVIASGSANRSAIVTNRTPDVTWAAGMNAYYVVWEARLEDGSNEVRGRRVKKKTGKPKGPMARLAGDGFLHGNPKVVAQKVDGKHDGAVFFLRRVIGPAPPWDVELRSQPFSRAGKPLGAAQTGDTVNTSAIGLLDVFPASIPDAGARQQGALAVDLQPPLAVNKCHWKIEVQGVSPNRQCILKLYLNGVLIGTQTYPGCFGRRQDSDGSVKFMVIDGPRIRQYEATTGATCDNIQVRDLTAQPLVDDEPVPIEEAIPVAPRRGRPIFIDDERRGDGLDDYLLTFGSGKTWIHRIDEKGRYSSREAFGYDGGLLGIVGDEVTTSGQANRESVIVFIDGPSATPAVRARVEPLEQQ